MLHPKRATFYRVPSFLNSMERYLTNGFIWMCMTRSLPVEKIIDFEFLCHNRGVSLIALVHQDSTPSELL